MSQINEVDKVLGRLDLFRERVRFPRYSDFGASVFRGLSYFDVWKTCYDNRIYDFRLFDESLIQFRLESLRPLGVAYAYYECPFSPRMPFEEFRDKQLGVEPERPEQDILLQFEFYQANPQKKETVAPLRYDYNPSQYIAGRHPASHVHFGHGNQIRVATRKVLRPLSFLFFVLRQCYPDAWSSLTNWGDAEILCRNIREHPGDVNSVFWNRLDKWEMILT